MRNILLVGFVLIVGLAFWGCQQQAPAPAQGQPGQAQPGAAAQPGAPVQPGSETVTVNTPEGTATITAGQGASEADFGVPFYPGATMTDGGGGTVNIQGPEGAGSVSAAAMQTKDPYQTVVNFYTQKLGKPTMSVNEVDSSATNWTTISADQKGMVQVTVATNKDTPGITEIIFTKTGGM